MNPVVIKLAVVHLAAVLLTVVCLLGARFQDDRALLLLPAGALLVVVFRTLIDLYVEIRELIRNA